MRAFDVLFRDVQRQESRVAAVSSHSRIPDGTFAFKEFYCHERGCDCRRVLLQVWWVERRLQVATINYAFDPSQPPPFDDEPQIMLDPMNPQSDISDALQDLFTTLLRDDPTWHEGFVRHYGMWKAVVDDPAHPDHPKVRGESHSDPTFRPAFPRREPDRREGPKIGRNDPCPCGSGKKSKKCCVGASGPTR